MPGAPASRFEVVSDGGLQTAVTVVIADDHPVVRRGLRHLLETEKGIDIVAEAANLADARRYVRGHHPDVLVLDLKLPDGYGIGAIPTIRRESPETQIVVLTMQTEPAYARQALGSGAVAYVLKEAAEAELVEAIRRAAVGERYLNPSLGARLAGELPAPPPDRLTKREMQVLRMIALGYTNGEIADELYLSVRTVELHRAHIQRKVRDSSRAGLVRYAIEHRLIEAEPGA